MSVICGSRSVRVDRTAAIVFAIAILAVAVQPLAAHAQSSHPWLVVPPTIEREPGSAPPGAQPPSQTPQAGGEVKVVALLTDDGQQITNGLVWHVFRLSAAGTVLVTSSRLPSPSFSLPAGRYVVNAAFGRAFLSKVVSLRDGQRKQESFVINAGGLKVHAKLPNGSTAAPGSVAYDVFADERDQNGERQRILSGVRPGVVLRLNSGIYQIVSRMGDANARIEAEVTVEAGKLTEATFVHDAGKATFKLVSQAGGEALADVEWIILGANGDVVKETAGALPAHVLAAGNYTVSARWSGKLFTRSFSIDPGDNVEVEVVIQ